LATEQVGLGCNICN